MRLLRCAGLLLLLAVLTSGQAIAQDHRAPNRSEVLVSSLYEQVVALHPHGAPYDADKAIFDPFISKALLHRLDLHDACIGDWFLQNPDPNLKPPGLEFGIFSGSNERDAPTAFRIERSEPRKDGSTRVYVRLNWSGPLAEPDIWRVAAVVVLEDGRPVVDDVLFLKEKSDGIEYSLSQSLSEGCNGPRWVGQR